MILKFPNLDALQKALGKKLIPPEVSQTALQAGFDDQDQLWLETAASLSRAALAELKKLNIQNPRTCSVKLNLKLSTWSDLATSQKYLLFADLDTLRVALSTGSVPVHVAQAPVVAGFDDQESIWVETPSNLTQAALKQLRKLGVQYAPKSNARLMARVSCWPELLPLYTDSVPTDHLEQTPVLFDLPTGERLAHLVTEVLRLGNDRQSFRWLDAKGADGSDPEASRALLRVVGPPYYSLLRAIDRQGQATAPIAFLERAPRVWVELGYTHPLIEQVKPGPGQLLLVRPPRQWTLIEEAPFRDVYEVMEYALPDQPVAWNEGSMEDKFKVSLSLKSGGSTEGGELWVLTDNPVEEVNHFVQNADEQIQNRLSFAVGKHGGKTTIVLRVRHSKLPPPVLILKATAYRPFLKLPNLFLPCGTWLHPKLRRDVVRQLLAEDNSVVTWLAPAGSGSFTPQSLPEDAFRPLTDWVDYVLDHDKEALQAWVQAAQFDFEPFVCDEEQPTKPKKATGSDRPRGKGGSSTSQDIDFPESVPVQEGKKKNTAEFTALEEDILDAEPADLDLLKLQQDLHLLEDQFQSLEGGLDIPERQELWPELARLNTALNNTDDASVCWLNALWGLDTPSGDYSWKWFRVEAGGVPVRNEPGTPRNRSWVSRMTLAGRANRELTAEDLDWLLNMAEPSSADLRALASILVWGCRNAPSPALLDRLNPLQRFLETHERLLPVRAAWLAWSSLVQLSKGDVLALARARDRLLERLFHNGLRPEQDLPSFLRFAGQPTSLRFRAVRQWLTELAEMAHDWMKAPGQRCAATANNAGYIDLIFSFGLARLGEPEASRELLDRAHTVLIGKDDVHDFLFNAFKYRIDQARESKPHTGPLPLEQMEYLEHMERMPRYVVDRLRQHSRILEPHLKIDPYRHWSSRTSDLEQKLAELVDLNDRKEVANRVHQLLREVPKGVRGAEARARILRAALELAPRVSEDFGREMLDQVMPTYDSLPETRDQNGLMEQANFLEKALFVAGHYDRIEHLHPLVGRFQTLLQSQKGDKAIHAIESLAGQVLRSLRKLGMREEIDQLLNLMEGVILQGQDIQHLDIQKMQNWPASLKALLHVAGERFYFGRDRQAEPVLQAVRAHLFREESGASIKDRTSLACVYAKTVGQAAVEVAQKRLEELFRNLAGIRDTYTTNSYSIQSGGDSKPGYGLSQLDVVEAVVLAVASEDFTLGSHARRWLDDDEFIVRRRIHRDLRAMLAHS